eukprot:4138431-Pleurochrysis_carterae.AAC.2
MEAGPEHELGKRQQSRTQMSLNVASIHAEMESAPHRASSSHRPNECCLLAQRQGHLRLVQERLDADASFHQPP